MGRIFGASVSEPHTSGFDAAFTLLYRHGGVTGRVWTSYVVSKYAVNILMSPLGFHTRHARTRMPQHSRLKVGSVTMSQSHRSRAAGT